MMKNKALFAGALAAVCGLGLVADSAFGAATRERVTRSRSRPSGGSEGEPGAPAACRKSVSPSGKLGSLYDLIRCPDSSFGYSTSKRQAVDQMRHTVRKSLAADEPLELNRALYVRLCALGLGLDDGQSLPAGIVIPCVWHADVVDEPKLKAEIASRPAEEQAQILSRLAADRQEVAALAEKQLPKAAHPRDYEIFHGLAMQAKQAYEQRREQNQDAYAALSAFDKAWREGEVAGCEKALEPALGKHVAGVKGNLEQVSARFGDELGYALTDSLAKCHYLNGREAEAAALLLALEKQARKVSLAEQVYYRQVEALAEDAEKAEKMPQLKGKKLSSYKPGDISVPQAEQDEATAAWDKSRYQLVRDLKITFGQVAKVSAADKQIEFKQFERTVIKRECRETNKIDRIDWDGRIVYRVICVETGREKVMTQPPPTVVTDVTGVTAGKFVRVVRISGKDSAVSLVADGQDENANIRRMAGFELK